LEAIEGAKAKISARVKERYDNETKDYEEKVRKRKEKEDATGKKVKGKEPTKRTIIKMVNHLIITYYQNL